MAAAMGVDPSVVEELVNAAMRHGRTVASALDDPAPCYAITKLRSLGALCSQPFVVTKGRIRGLDIRVDPGSRVRPGRPTRAVLEKRGRPAPVTARIVPWLNH